jgi:hypothetical protein
MADIPECSQLSGTIPAGETIAVTVACTPLRDEETHVTLGLTWEEVPGAVPQEVDIPVVCKIAHPRLVTDVDTINFGNVILRNEVVITITLTNVGDGPVFEWTALLPAQFVKVEPSCGVCKRAHNNNTRASLCICVFFSCGLLLGGEVRAPSQK